MTYSQKKIAPEIIFNKKYSADIIRTHSIMISTSKTRKKKVRTY
jgi:hypothetical protein